ncbi:hypothetical protein CPB97_009889 [Podila verticillata]|nr:hypothetical protein CPB97_009889 [Podila verticillata]
MPFSSFHTLPTEIHQLILDRLSQHDLVQWTLVSRDWLAVCTPLLWKTLSIITRHAYLRFQSPEAQTALIRNAHLVQDLTTIYFPVIESLFRPSSITNTLSDSHKNPSTLFDKTTSSCICTNLVQLDLEHFWRTPFPVGHSGEIGSMVYGPPPYLPNFSPEQEQLIRQLIQSNPHLRVLTLSRELKRRTELLAVLSDAHLPHLQELNLCMGRSGYWTQPSLETAQQFLENCPQGLKKLVVDLTIAWKPRDNGLAAPEEEEEALARCLPHRSMESLILSTNLPGRALERLLLPFLKSCRIHQTLKTARVHAPFINDSERIRSALTDLGICPKKNELDFENVFEVFSDEDAAELLASEDEWTSICLNGLPGRLDPPGPLMVETLLERCGYLENLDIFSSAEYISSRQLQQILCRSPRLLSLDASLWHLDDSNARNLKLDAHDAIREPWACSRMTHLKIEIGGVPRPDIKVGYDGSLDIRVDRGGCLVKGTLFGGTVEESHRIQRQVYQQLARLTELTELQLGGDLWEADEYTHQTEFGEQGQLIDVDMLFQLNCLEMSLDSGLDLLSGLKELRVLDVTRMAHRIGVPELEWMQRNWPNLEKAMSKHHPDLIMCRKQPGIAIGRLCEKCDGRCVVCDSYVRPVTLVRICDECNYGSFQGRCVICGSPGVSDAYYCANCTRAEKDRDGCPKIVNLGSSKTDLFYERKKFGFKKR